MKEFYLGRDKDMSKQRIALLIGTGALALAVVVGCATANKPQTSPTESHETSQQTPEASPEYPVHQNITATKFWVGEGASDANANIHNLSTVWLEDAVAAYGGIDDPNKRGADHLPNDFTPQDNPYYFALPFSDYDENGPKSVDELSVVPWFDGKPVKDGGSILKGQWIEASYNGQVIYAQWYDAGPFGEDDAGYVFGDDSPADSRAGLDLSPAAADQLGFDGQGTEDGREKVSWRFVRFEDVPEGPWKTTITDSSTNFS